MNVRKLLGMTGQVCRRRGLSALVYLLLQVWKMSGNTGHLLACSGKFRVFLARGDAIADQKNLPWTFLFVFLLPVEGCGKHTERTGVNHVHIFDPVVRLRLVHH